MIQRDKNSYLPKEESAIVWEVGVINSERSEEGVEQSRGTGATEE